MASDHEDEDLKMALLLSMQHDSPEAKRSKAGESDVLAVEEEAPEVRNRRIQRELMAAAAEKRLQLSPKAVAATVAEKSGGSTAESMDINVNLVKNEGGNVKMGEVLSEAEAQQLFLMIFGDSVSKDILVQWSNQGIRFSTDPETSMGLVQHEGGPCGVLAAIQAFVLKSLLFFLEEIDDADIGTRIKSENACVTEDTLPCLTEQKKSRALVKSMCEILFLCGNNQKAVIASPSILAGLLETVDLSDNEVITKVLGDVSIESGSDLHKFLRIDTYTSVDNAFDWLEKLLPVFGGRLGAMLFLISALLSRGLDGVQEDRDDPGLPLVTAPFGHASQEIVNLLLSGKAVANVFDGRMDLGGGMFVNGITTSVEVGFLTLLESLNYCKVGVYLKCPKWPIWVIGSESHYTVLFALDPKVQEENELESRESQIRRAFDAQDQSGGGGFVSVEGFHHVLRETGITLPPEKLDQLCNSGFIVWNEFWQILLNLDKSFGGLKDSGLMMGKKVFNLYHFNGIAKSVMNSNHTFSGGDNPIQKPRLTKLKVSVPPRWTSEGYMAEVAASSNYNKYETSWHDTSIQLSKPEPAQHAPLVDCIRTRWPRSVCNWEGDAPSIV